LGEPTPDTLLFPDHIENADLNSLDFSKDDLYASWGHYQFTTSSQTISMVVGITSVVQ